MGCVVPGAGTPIQTPIDDAGAGDTIYVHAGAYCENVDVDKRITLIGWGRGHNRMPSVIKNHYSTLNTEKTV